MEVRLGADVYDDWRWTITTCAASPISLSRSFSGTPARLSGQFNVYKLFSLRQNHFCAGACLRDRFHLQA